LAVGLDVAISVALTFGQTRYRSTFEVSLVLLAAVQLDWFWSRLRRQPGEVPLGAQSDDDGSRDLVAPEDEASGQDRPAGVAVPAPAG
jgi:hypothetical protein